MCGFGCDLCGNEIYCYETVLPKNRVCSVEKVCESCGRKLNAIHSAFYHNASKRASNAVKDYIIEVKTGIPSKKPKVTSYKNLIITALSLANIAWFIAVLCLLY